MSGIRKHVIAAAVVALVLGAVVFTISRIPKTDLVLALEGFETNARGSVVARVLVSNTCPHTLEIWATKQPYNSHLEANAPQYFRLPSLTGATQFVTMRTGTLCRLTARSLRVYTDSLPDLVPAFLEQWHPASLTLDIAP